MELFALVYRSLKRHPLRSGLTALGIAVALLAFVLIRTIIGAWYAGVEASAKNRLIVRNSVSLVFYLPVAYYQQITQVPGVQRAGWGNWFGAKYGTDEIRFQQFAVDDNYVNLYPEYQIASSDKDSWLKDRKGILVGKELADRFNLKVGDVLQLQGTIFPGLWEFIVRGIFDAGESGKDTRIMYFHWEYLNQRNKIEIQRQPDHVGYFVVELAPGANPAAVGQEIDKLFKNSYAETLTETETQFIQGFVSMSSTIIQAMNAISGVVVITMLLVLANTMLLSFRERSREFTILKALGFGPRSLSAVILGEALILSAVGFILLILIISPVFFLPAKAILGDLSNFFPIFKVTISTLLSTVIITVSVAILASVAPIRRVVQFRVTDGIRAIDG